MDFFSPLGLSLENALLQAQHIAIAAHQDDLEFMCAHAISQSFKTKSFFGIIVTDGAGSPRSGSFAKVSDSEMKNIRLEEQKSAANLGQYCGILQLGYSSADLKNQTHNKLIEQLKGLLKDVKLKTLWTHNVCDRHLSHTRVCWHVLKALRELPKNERPTKLFGCEVWGALDWLSQSDRKEFGISAEMSWLKSLMNQFPSQIEGGKNYTEAVLGRKTANATLSSSHQVDTNRLSEICMDMSPLVLNESLNINSYIKSLIQNFSTEVLENWPEDFQP